MYPETGGIHNNMESKTSKGTSWKAVTDKEKKIIDTRVDPAKTKKQQQKKNILFLGKFREIILFHMWTISIRWFFFYRLSCIPFIKLKCLQCFHWFVSWSRHTYQGSCYTSQQETHWLHLFRVWWAEKLTCGLWLDAGQSDQWATNCIKSALIISWLSCWDMSSTITMILKHDPTQPNGHSSQTQLQAVSLIWSYFRRKVWELVIWAAEVFLWN